MYLQPDMIYTDGHHLTADSLDELHAFADSIHIKECWYDNRKKTHPHYDLYKYANGKVVHDPAKLERALAAGAVKVPRNQLLTISQKLAQ